MPATASAGGKGPSGPQGQLCSLHGTALGWERRQAEEFNYLQDHCLS